MFGIRKKRVMTRATIDKAIREIWNEMYVLKDSVSRVETKDDQRIANMAKRLTALEKREETDTLMQELNADTFRVLFEYLGIELHRVEEHYEIKEKEKDNGKTKD